MALSSEIAAQSLIEKNDVALALSAQLKFSVEQNNTNRHRVSILKIQTLRHYCSSTIEVL